MPPLAATRQAPTTMPAPSCRTKPAPATMPWRRIAHPPKTGPESALWRALLHRRGAGKGEVPRRAKRGLSAPLLPPPALPPAACRPSNPARPEECPGNALQALVLRRRGPGRPQIPPRPFRAFLGPFLPLRGPSYGPTCSAMPPASGYRPLAARGGTRKAGVATMPPRTRCHAARPDAARPGRPRGATPNTQVCAALRGKTISLPECSGYNVTKNSRVT